MAQHAGLSVPECVTVYVGDFWSYMRNCAHRFDSCFVDLADGMSAKHDPGNVEALSSFATVVIVDFDPYLDDFLSGSLVSKVQERGLSIYTWKKGNP